MKTHIFPLAILSILLSSCMTQPSAPIDYGSGISSAGRGSISTGSDDIVEKPIIREKTNWGDSQIHEETSNINPDEAPTESYTPPPPQAPALRMETISHEVIEGETVDSISRQYGIDREALIKANKLKAPYKLEELQIIKIPPQVATDSDVAVGDIIAPSATTGAAPAPDVSDTPIVAPILLPVSGAIISKFGDNNAGVKNNGINIQAPLGSDVHSLSTGSVVFAGNDPKFGNLVIVKSENEDIFMAYSHMNDLILKKGDTITNGQIIGHIGQTGTVTSPQLHFAVRQGKTPIDPVEYLN